MNAWTEIAAETLSAAHFLLEGLKEVGIEYLFVNMGTDHAPLIEELARWKAEGLEPPALVICPHESTAAHMAGGFALATGRGQAALVHVDVGTANAAMGMHNMARSRLPMMLLAGKAPYTSHGELLGSRDNYVHFIQEPADQGALVRPYAKWEYTLQSGVTAKEVVRRAHTIMQSGARGPVYLMLPREALTQEVEVSAVASFPTHKHGPAEPSGIEQIAIADLAERLMKAERGIILTSYGGHTEGTSEAIDRLSQLVGMRVFEPNMVSNISHEMACFSGFAAGKHLGSADVGLIVDSDVPWMPSQQRPNPDTYWAHIDVDVLKPSSPIWSFPADRRLEGNSARILGQLIDYIEERADAGLRAAAAARVETIRAERSAMKAKAREAAADPGSNGAINPRYFLSELGKALREDDMILHEAVRNQPAMVQQIARSRGNTMVRTGGGGLGASGGMALGYKLAKPQALVVQIIGDGGFFYNNPSSVYAVSRQYDLPILTIVLDNAGWSAVKESTLRVYPDGHAKSAEDFGSQIERGTRFAVMAEMFGFAGFTLSDPLEVSRVVAEAVETVRGGRTAIVHVHVPDH
ncbi:thiamine pyrophosphate-requiring protein [Arsenicitalea aurantiaca]|uniref:Thiamine pyrophosphate-requiring protein n=1 Tax=Arsenicitalea aurantiaca TaxID=1783274 RepID=A0A433XKY2_9HYPH|nr:thiamine pyrophosphate-requiring protein [Arsenicitalea aurantiaca]RUT34684.1 thiamine pyrophosphate-requiring protein [Arsenicitalea aurantiaca]